MKNKDEKTSREVASKAARILRDKNSTPEMKSIAGSVLTQTADKQDAETNEDK